MGYTLKNVKKKTFWRLVAVAGKTPQEIQRRWGEWRRRKFIRPMGIRKEKKERNLVAFFTLDRIYSTRRLQTRTVRMYILYFFLFLLLQLPPPFGRQLC